MLYDVNLVSARLWCVTIVPKVSNLGWIWHPDDKIFNSFTMIVPNSTANFPLSLIYNNCRLKAKTGSVCKYEYSCTFLIWSADRVSMMTEFTILRGITVFCEIWMHYSISLVRLCVLNTAVVSIFNHLRVCIFWRKIFPFPVSTSKP